MESPQSHTINVVGIAVNLSPDAFARGARHFYKCRQDFQSPDKFSPLPYFLLCRAIELALKAIHLHTATQATVKDRFGHDLIGAYGELPEGRKTLDPQEVSLLDVASAIYRKKGFEYFVAEHALCGFRPYPDLGRLDALAAKLVAAVTPNYALKPTGDAPRSSEPPGPAAA